MTDTMLETVYTFVKTYIQQHGYSPSIRQIAKGCYISLAYTVHCLDILEARGRLTRERGQARSLHLRDGEE